MISATIRRAEFVTSSENPSQCPKPNIPEYAFIGRSNVGKSSLINYLTQRKDLAKTSGKPGKTRTINHFLIDENWYLVDLPGYGYAKTSKVERKKYDQMIRNYLLKRENLICIYLLIDARIPPQNIDLEFIAWLGMSSLPFEIIFTKADNSKKTDVEGNIQSFKDMLGNDWDELPNSMVTTATKGKGREEVLTRIEELNNELSETVAERYKQSKNASKGDDQSGVDQP